MRIRISFSIEQGEVKPVLSAFRQARDRLFGHDDASVAIPVFDGPLKPNNILENAEVLFEREGLEDLIHGEDGSLYAACSRDLLRIDDGGDAHSVVRLNCPIQAIAQFEGGFALATSDGIVFHDGNADGRHLNVVDGEPLICVNALWTTGNRTLLISQGSRRNPYEQWSRDLLSHGSTGRVIEFDPSSGTTRVLASGLEYCYGVCSEATRIIVSESWRHRVVAIEGDRREVMVNALPSYPGRIRPADDGGYWVSSFAARTQLVEFVLREDGYREEMMRTVEPRYWVAPALTSGNDFREPLQIGGVRQMGILKPWAPPRSYGLVIRYDQAWRPLYSLHSRVGGKHHGIAAASECNGALYVLSKGAGRILRVPFADLNVQE